MRVGAHRYLSTYCRHGRCGECRVTCKWCPATCGHTCHGGTEIAPRKHIYLSTSCWHGRHEHCQSSVAVAGHDKIPGTCMWCPAECICGCHG